MADNGKAVFDRTVYGSSGNTGNSGNVFGGGAPVMGSPSQVMSTLRAQGKIKRQPTRGRRPPQRNARRGRR